MSVPADILRTASRVTNIVLVSFMYVFTMFITKWISLSFVRPKFELSVRTGWARGLKEIG